MKTAIISIVLTIFAGALLAADKEPAATPSQKPKEFDSLVTTKGKEYAKVTVREVTPAGIKIFHEAGAATIPFEELPKNIQESLGGFDEAAARQHREDEERRLRAQERAIDQEMANVNQQEQGKKREAALDTVKLATRVRVKQMNEGGALCEVSIRTLQKFERKVPRPLGGNDIKVEEKWVWSGYSEEWYFVAGLPEHLVDGDTWEGWTLPSGSHPYTNTLGARKTVRKLDVVAPPKK